MSKLFDQKKHQSLSQSLSPANQKAAVAALEDYMTKANLSMKYAGDLDKPEFNPAP